MSTQLPLLLTGWEVPAKTEEVSVRSYSTTADILSYKRCRRQYGYFGVRGFSSATNTQRYFGTLVHDVLDQINRDQRTGLPLPNSEIVEEMISAAHDRLIRSGVRPYNARAQQEHAAKLIYRFVVLVGPAFFPNVQETEYRLERALQTPVGYDYVLHGVVDVLSGAVSHALELPFSTEPDDIEIWDYKAGRMPEKGSSELRDYEFQMRVYADLYRRQSGQFPARCVLAFLGELGSDAVWDETATNIGVYPRLIYTIHPHPRQIELAMANFHETVEAIEAERQKPYAEQWLEPEHPVDLPTCEACDMRFNCRCFPDGARQRSEVL